MTHEEIIAMARYEGLSFVPDADSPLARIVRKAVAKEREACALVCDRVAQDAALSNRRRCDADALARSIRARGQKEGV